MGSLVTELFYTRAMTRPLGVRVHNMPLSSSCKQTATLFQIELQRQKEKQPLIFPMLVHLCQQEVLNVISSNTCVASGLDFLSHMPLEDNSYPILSCFLRNDQRGAAEHY